VSKVEAEAEANFGVPITHSLAGIGAVVNRVFKALNKK
jgi:hypothetical protein